MSNSIFDWPASLKRFVRFTSAKADDVNDALDVLSAGMDVVEADIRRAIKLPSGTADQTLGLTPAQRAMKLLSFDTDGNVTAVSGGGLYKGDWAAGTQYVVSDYFRDPATKDIYSVLRLHTAASIVDDVAAGNIVMAINVGDVALAMAAAEQAAAQAAIARDIALASANFAGDWSALSGALAFPASVYHLGSYWMLLESLSDVALEVPGSSAKWAPMSPSALPVVHVSGTSKLAVPGRHYSLENASLTTITLPASPRDGDVLWVTVANGRTDNIMARNGGQIMGVAEDMKMNLIATYPMRYMTNTWRFL